MSSKLLTISVDEETLRAIDNLKKEEMTFNLSSYIRNIICTQDKSNKVRSINDIEVEKEDAKHLIKQQELRIQKLDHEIAQLKVQEERKKYANDESKQKALEKEDRRGDTFDTFATDWFEIPEADLPNLRIEFKKSSMALRDFLEMQGYDEKE